MDESLQQELAAIDSEVDGALRQQREQARQFLSKWKEQAKDTDHELLQQLNDLAQHVAASSEDDGTK